uniref:t-SNARE coiled-coil homology domain-containing protein n=1 Tax=Ananas comosus var. bracteatus TaxID=296719 RepID=A0A6V7QF23_ANACO|nr:unnamed protein product [Ananas comosus var. bracteatus]
MVTRKERDEQPVLVVVEARRRPGIRGGGGGVEMGASGASLDRFFEDVEGIKEELREVERIQRRLQEANEAGKTLHEAAAVRGLRARMDADVAQALKKAKLDGPHAHLRGGRAPQEAEGLDGGVRGAPEAGGGEYRETVRRRYYTVTGEEADEATVEALAATGEGERFLQRAIEEQGRGRVVDVIAEIQERHGAVAELERSLLELQQVFLDMAVLVEAQGEQLDDIENHVGRAKSFVDRGREQLQVARTHQKSTRKWTCFAIILLLIIILVIVLPIVLTTTKNNK